MKTKAIVLVLSLVLLMSLSAIADVPDEITYQGRLLYNGSPVIAATSVVFRLYQTSSGGSAIWTETHGSVTPDSNGIYTEILGVTTAIPDDYDALWLELVVAGNVLTPRKKLTSAPFVLRAGELPALYVSGNVGIGTTSVFGKLDVKASGTIGRFYTDTSASGLQIKSTQSSSSGWLLDVRQSANSDGSGGTQVFGVKEDGRVGIGTTNPEYLFHLNRTGNGSMFKVTTDYPGHSMSIWQAPSDFYERFLIMSIVGNSRFVFWGNGNAYADGSWTGPADYAEYFYSDDIGLSFGELVSLAGKAKVKRCNQGDTLIGVVSKKPGVVGIYADDITDAAAEYEEDPHWIKVAIMGQVPVNVSISNGVIRAGDQLTAGDNGVAVYGESPDTLLMVALDDAGEDGTIRVLIK